MIFVGNPRQIQAKAWELDEKQLYELREHKEKRSLSQNAYYWQLLGQLAGKLKMSKPECHNRLLRKYGQVQIFGGKAARLPLPDTDETEETALASTTTHLRPTAQTMTMADGVTYRTYVLLKPSHDMDTAEMSQLLDGCVEECKQQEIETLTPRQLAELRQIEERRAKKWHTEAS